MTRAMAAALAALAAMIGGPASAGDAQSGEARYAMNCVNCHGKGGEGMASFPSLAARDATYISERLTSYRARETVGPNSALMYAWAADLSDEDIANLAAFIASKFQ